jgi:hypothetical protein
MRHTGTTHQVWLPKSRKAATDSSDRRSDLDEEDPEEFFARAVEDPQFRRFMLQMRFCRFLSDSGFDHIHLSCDESRHHWQFSLRCGRRRVRQIRALEFSFRAAAAKLARKVKVGSFHAQIEDDLITGDFATKPFEWIEVNGRMILVDEALEQ